MKMKTIPDTIPIKIPGPKKEYNSNKPFYREEKVC